MRAGVIGNDLRGAGADEVGKPRIRNLDGRMQRVDRVEDLLHRIGRGARRQIDAHAKGEFGFGDAHFVARHRSRSAIWYHGLGQDAPGHRAVDIDVLLSGLAGGCDLPAEQTSGRIFFDFRLDRVAVDAIVRPQSIVEAGEFGAGAPVVVQRLRCGCYRFLVEHGFDSLSADHDFRLRAHSPQQPQHADFVIETQPAVGEKLVRARCRNTALPRPAIRGPAL